jgi:hypothetical protein
MYQKVMRETRVAMEVAHYVVFSYDEIFIVDNQSWLFIHCYVMHNWVRILIFVYLDHVVEGSWSDNLTKLGDYVGFDDRWRFTKRPNCLKVHMFWGKWC